MASRHVKCSCPACDAIWRMARSHIDRADAGDGLRCPVCYEPALVGDAGMTTEEQASLRAICDSIVEGAVRDINCARAKRLEEVRRRRAHGLEQQRRAHGGAR